MPVVSLKGITRCWSKHSEPSMCLNNPLAHEVRRAPPSAYMPKKLCASCLGPSGRAPWLQPSSACPKGRTKEPEGNIWAALSLKENRALSPARRPLISHGCGGGRGFQRASRVLSSDTCANPPSLPTVSFCPCTELLGGCCRRWSLGCYPPFCLWLISQSLFFPLKAFRLEAT